MPRKQHHYIYKTTCQVTGRYYIGMHSTSNLEDGYMGSGRRLRYSLKKYGNENHTKEIIETLLTRESLIKREAEIVNTQMLNDPMCMNLKPGGTGGLSNEIHKQKFLQAGTRESAKSGKAKETMKRLLADESWSSSYRLKISESLKGRQFFKGKTHTADTKKKMSESHRGRGLGENNSQFGTMWITNGVEAKKIKKSDPIPSGWVKGRIKK